MKSFANLCFNINNHSLIYFRIVLTITRCRIIRLIVLHNICFLGYENKLDTALTFCWAETLPILWNIESEYFARDNFFEAHLRVNEHELARGGDSAWRELHVGQVCSQNPSAQNHLIGWNLTNHMDVGWICRISNFIYTYNMNDWPDNRRNTMKIVLQVIKGSDW